MISVPLSVLELTWVQEGHSAQEALADTVEIARRIERLGYRRFWVGEHHSTYISAGVAPAVIIAQVAASTSSIMVGSGVMLSNHAPFAVAEQFATLDALHPGRIDLGVGSGAGTTNERAVQALRRSSMGRGATDYARDVRALIEFLAGGISTDDLVLLPWYESSTPLWLLATSQHGASLAADLGLPLVVGHHIRPENTAATVARYREAFQPSRWSGRPYVMLSVQAVCADTDERAEVLSRPADLLRADLVAGRTPTLLSPEAASFYEPSGADLDVIARARMHQVRGEPHTVVRRLAKLVAECRADELMIMTPVYDLADRTRSFELIVTTVAAEVAKRS
ncbi:LLM class flavin-dependent oxidoreductase [Pseudonocardia sp. CA-142604]|uniref:LLM class flavin-dependent oxidoreductase n=1 Tax=Pseudonocardia sp. CA-142604 TaxID=3240024 RepID=UPI003D909F8B